jgi:hypothetical protein
MHQSPKVVIDEGILQWADEHTEELKKEYTDILQVGKHPDLPQGSDDEKIAAYCHQNDYDLITGDTTFYVAFFKAGIISLMIRKRGFWEIGNRPVYLVHIED